ncbi:ankyrin repeat domain-containing protein [Brachyspira sp.]
MKYLVENGADINIKDKNENTALNYARTEGIKEVLRKAEAK